MRSGPSRQIRRIVKVIKILFVCHGNICRSPIAEFYMKDIVNKRGMDNRFFIDSAAVTSEEIIGGVGNPVYPPARKILADHGISCEGKRARLATKEDYDKFDLILVMDKGNERKMERIAGGDPEGKILLLMSICGEDREVADPWFTGDFQAAWDDVTEGCKTLLDLLTFPGELVLASGSPRRLELLEQVGISCIVDPSDGEEWSQESSPAAYVEELSREKVLDVADRHPDSWLLGSDTVVALDGEIMGKPGSADEAFEMLSKLSGRTHHVYTGVTLVRTSRGTVLYHKTFSTSTEVTFYDLSDEMIEDYILTGEPFDKAGAYGIQGRGAVLVKEIRGDYNTVVGLPVAEVYHQLTE